MGKSDNKSQVLGDDPLAWLNAGTDEGKKAEEKKSKPKKGAVKKTDTGKTKPRKKKKEKKPKAETKKNISRLELEPSMVINKAGEFYGKLNNLAVNDKALEIDASKVEVIDSAILQLLYAFVLDLKEKSITVTWSKPSEGLMSKASMLGLAEQLGL